MLEEWQAIDDLLGERVSVHWHYPKKLYSISTYIKGKGWRVLYEPGHDRQLLLGKVVLYNADFHVNPGGKKRAFVSGRRNVHASVIGTLRGFELEPTPASIPCGSMVYYSHELYSAPEFKVIPNGYTDHFLSKPMSDWPGIEWAEMVSLGVQRLPGKDIPSMLAAGRIRHTR